MKKLCFLLLFVISLYPFVQAEAASCPEGMKRGPGGDCYKPKCDDPGQMVNSKGSCVDSPLVDGLHRCEYIIDMKGTNKSANIQATKCGGPTVDAIVNGNSLKSCGIVDDRCSARVRCYYRPIGSINDGGSGVNLPPLTTMVTCPSINEECPEDPMDCLRNNEISVVSDQPVFRPPSVPPESNGVLDGAFENIEEDDIRTFRPPKKKSGGGLR